MIGAIIGDIVGSRFERDNYRAKDFELFADACFPTDDSIMTVAVGTFHINGIPNVGNTLFRGVITACGIVHRYVHLFLFACLGGQYGAERRQRRHRQADVF